MQVVRLCYPIDIMTATNWNNLQIYPCKNQEGGTFMLYNRHLQISISYRSTHVKKQACGTFMLSNRHHQQQIGITYRSTHVKSRQVVHLCYPIDIMTGTN